MRSLPPPPPPAKAQGAGKKAWRKPELLFVSFDDTAGTPTPGTSSAHPEGPYPYDPTYDPSLS